jgi:hypothetical protein
VTLAPFLFRQINCFGFLALSSLFITFVSSSESNQIKLIVSKMVNHKRYRSDREGIMTPTNKVCITDEFSFNALGTVSKFEVLQNRK